jgi:hypothetical protein
MMIPNGQTRSDQPGVRVDVSGRVAAIAVDPRDPEHILVGAAGGGIWESRDGGGSWSPRTDHALTLAIGALVFDPDSATVLAGTGEGNFWSYLGAGVLSSADGGTTWTPPGPGPGPFTGKGFYDLIMDGGRAYAATTAGLHLSDNAGQQWIPRRDAVTWSVSAGTGELLCGSADGVFRSADRGDTWTAEQLPGAPGSFTRLAVAFAPSDRSIAYAWGAAGTGALLWEDVFDGGPFDEARSVAVHGGRVFVSGVSTDTGLFSRRFTVRAYDLGAGTLLWQDRVPSGHQGFYGADGAAQVTVEDDRVVAAGVVTDAAGFHFAVRAYDAKTGTLLWSDLVDRGGGADFANGVALDGGRAFAVGQGGAACSFGLPSNCDWLIRAYDQRTGVLLWERQVDREGGDADQANVVLAHGDQIVVAGGAGSSPTEPLADWLVQVYGADTGALVWEDLLATPGKFAYPVGLAVAGSRLLVTGSTLDLAGGTQDGDWVVRAHELGRH